MNCELLKRIGSHDTRAILELYDLHSRSVYSVALRVCQNSASAEEVLQEVFLQVWRKPQEFVCKVGGLPARLAVLARDLAVEHRRLGMSIQPNGQSRIKHSRTLQPLAEANRRLLEMAFFDGQTLIAIEKRTGLPPHVAAARIGKALADLRKDANSDCLTAHSDKHVEL